MATQEPTRVEVDLPDMVVNKYGSLELRNGKPLSGIVGNFFAIGSTVRVYVIAESDNIVQLELLENSD